MSTNAESGGEADAKQQAESRRPNSGPKTISQREGQDLNLAVIAGHISAEPATKALPSGDTALSFSVTVRKASSKTTSVPVVWFDPPRRATTWCKGDQVIVSGEVVRRFYRAGGGLGSAVEVVVERAELCRHSAKLGRLVMAARQALQRYLPT